MRKYLIAGLIILLPLVLTVFVVVFLVDLFTAPFINLMTDYLSHFKSTITILDSQVFLTFIARILILILLCIAIMFLGAIARWFFIKGLISFTNKFFSKIPFIKNIYNVTRDILSAFFSPKGRKAFQKPVMTNFPNEKTLCLGFISGEIPQECKEAVDKNLTPVFLPTAPHPISGYLLMVPDDQLKEIEMTNEDAVKFTVSCGMILPQLEREQKDEPR
jgi:uncharacterized membrane protein